MADRQRRSTWQVHESTARALCQLTFVLFGLLPLVVCLFWSAQQFLPTYQRHQARKWEHFLSSQLGVSVKVAAYESRAPERFALHEIRLNHPETGATIARARLAEVERKEGKWSIRLTQPEVEQIELATAGRIAHEWLLCRPQVSLQAVRVGTNELTIHAGGSNRRVLRDVTATLFPASEATLLSVQFYPGEAIAQSQLDKVASGDTEHATSASVVPRSSSASAELASQTSKPAQWIIRRQHRADGLKTEMQLRTGTAAVPFNMLSGLSPLTNRLGDQAKFTGTADLQWSDGAWRIKLTDALFSELEVGQLTSDSEAAISGTGQMFFEQLIVSQQGIEFAHGGGEIRAGKMAAGLFYAFEKYLGVTARGSNQVSTYAFDRFEFAVHIQQPSLHLKCMMSDAHGWLASREAWEESLPIEAVVTALASCSGAGNANPNGSEMAGLPSTWLSRLALMWLPLGDPQWQAAQCKCD